MQQRSATWDDYPPVQVPEIDREHLRMGNDLRHLVAAVKDDDRGLAATLAQSLVDSARAHFASEERLMREIDFAHYTRHKQTHDRFVEEALLRLGDLQTEGLTGHCLRWVASTMGWFRGHVRIEDMALGRAINGATRLR